MPSVSRAGQRTIITALSVWLASASALAQPGQPDKDNGAARNNGAAAKEAAQSNGLGQAQATQLARQQGLVRLTRLLDREVVTADRENLGTIHDLAIDTKRAQVTFVVLSFGEWFGMGGRMTAVPFAAFELPAQGEAVIARVGKDQLEQSETFAPDELPDMTRRPWAQQTSEHFGYAPYWTRGVDAEPADAENDQPERGRSGITPAQPDGPDEAERGEPPAAQPRGQDEPGAAQAQALPLRRAKALLDRPVISSADEALGTVTDLIVDMREGRIAFALLSTDQAPAVDGALALVPFRALTFDAARQRYALEAEAATVDSLAFDVDSWPDLTNQQWAANVHQQFNREPYWQVFGYGAYLRDGGNGQARRVRQTLAQAGVEDDQIDRLQARNFPRAQVTAALQQAYLDKGLSQQEAEAQARQAIKRIDALQRGGGGSEPSDPATLEQPGG
jgi:sporulation protein YlmC with PRC-barrel domain